MENFAAAALNGVPSWNLTPLRSLKVYWSPSGEMVQDSASPGTSWVVSSGECHQGLDDAPADAVGVEVRHLGGVEVDRLGDEPHHEGARGLGRGRPAADGERERKQKQQGDEPSDLHRATSRFR